ncbi:hypothetical protein Bca101_030744 [Brassica carinata]
MSWIIRFASHWKCSNVKQGWILRLHLISLQQLLPCLSPQQTGIEFLSSPNHAQTIRASVRTIPIFTGDKPTKPRASAIDVKETVNDDMCVLISSFNYQCLHFGLNHEFAVTARALVLFFVICAGVQENGKLPTENEPKIGLSLQNVRTVKVEGFPSLFRYMFTKQQRTP